MDVVEGLVIDRLLDSHLERHKSKIDRFYTMRAIMRDATPKLSNIHSCYRILRDNQRGGLSVRTRGHSLSEGLWASEWA